MYKECISCPKLGVSCDGANLMALSSTELLEWCRERKRLLNYSNAKLAEISGAPKGTIDRLFSQEPSDYRHETMHIIVRALVGGEIGGNPCPDPNDTSNQHLKEVIEMQKEEIADLKRRIQIHKEEHKRDVDYYRKAYSGLRRTTICLVALLAVILMAAVILLLIDNANPDIGWIRRT